MPRGMPWWVTQSMVSSVWRRSRERRRTVWTPGMTRVPLPVMILKPRLSWTSTAAAPPPRLMPEMMSASFGSATRHMSLKMMMAATAMTAATIRMTMSIPAFGSHLGDDHRAGREVLHDHDARSRQDLVVAIGGIRVKRLGAAAHRDHDLADNPGGDLAGDPADLSHHLLVSHATSLGLVEAEGRVRSHG